MYMYTYVYVYICIYMYSYIYAHIHIYTYIYTYIHIYIHTYIPLSNAIHSMRAAAQLEGIQCISFDIGRYVYIYVYKCICTCIYVCVYTYMHTYRGSRVYFIASEQFLPPLHSAPSIMQTVYFIWWQTHQLPQHDINILAHIPGYGSPQKARTFVFWRT